MTLYITAMRNPDLNSAYRHCLAMARTHYENFPVASRLLPRRVREPIAVIYAFARSADDLADEGSESPARRLHQLDDYGARLEAAIAGHPTTDPIFVALADVIQRHRLPPALFRDLLAAFRSDVTTTRYATFSQVLAYCRCSANPVGRLLLHLHGAASEQNLRDSDAICTALQLINFYQDIGQDYDENNRIYIPLDEMTRAGVTESDIRERRDGPALRALVDLQLDRARELMLRGAPLGRRLRGRFGFEIRLIIAGGLRVLSALRARRATVFARPRLTASDWGAMLWSALTESFPPTPAAAR